MGESMCTRQVVDCTAEFGTASLGGLCEGHDPAVSRPLSMDLGRQMEECKLKVWESF